MRGRRIPVVFLHPSDPLADGLAKSLSRPGGNLTGVFGPRDVVAKQLERLPAPRAAAASSAHARRPDRPEDGANPEASTRARRRSCNDRSSWTFGKPRPQPISKRIFRSLRPGEVDGAFLLSNNLRQNHSALTIKLAKRGAVTGPGEPQRVGRAGGALLVRHRSRAARASRRALRRQHPQGHVACRPARREDPEDRVRDQSQDRQQARHQGSAGHDHPGRQGLQVARVTTVGAAAWKRPRGRTDA